MRKKLPFQLVSLHLRGHQADKRDYDDLTGPEQLSVLADHRATVALQDLRAAGQLTEFYPLPACRCYLCGATGSITCYEQHKLRTELPEYELQANL